MTTQNQPQPVESPKVISPTESYHFEFFHHAYLCFDRLGEGIYLHVPFDFDIRDGFLYSTLREAFFPPDKLAYLNAHHLSIEAWKSTLLESFFESFACGDYDPQIQSIAQTMNLEPLTIIESVILWHYGSTPH